MSTVKLLPRKRKADDGKTKMSCVATEDHSSEKLMRELYDDPHCDMVIVCQDGAELPCHRAIMAMASQKVRDLIIFHERVAFHLPDFSADTVRQFLRRCYCFKDEESIPEEVNELLNCLGVKSLKKEPVAAMKIDRGNPPDIVKRIEMATKCVVERVKKDPPKIRPPPPKSNESLLCWECGVDFKSRKVLADHLKEHDGINAYLCISCDKEFPNQEGLNEHIKNHVNLGTCHLCPEQIMTIGDLKLHLKRNHNRGDSVDLCEHCSFEGQSRNDLVWHYRRCHKGKSLPARPKNCRPFEQRVQCEKCPAMVIKSKMPVHMQKQHDPKLPFECNFCLYRSISAHGIHTHETRHHHEQKHGKSKEKIPCGNDCGVLFTMESSMRWHMKRYCSKSTVKKDMIDREKLTGRAEKVRASNKLKREMDKKRRLELLDEKRVLNHEFA